MRSLVPLLGVMGLLGLGDVQAQSASKGGVFCCTDNGHQVCGDTLPPQCFNKSYRELSPQGTVRRLVEAPLTPEQLARREAEEKVRRAEQARLRAEQRRNQSLLETYAKKDITPDSDLSKIEPPTMSDLQQVLDGMEGGADLAERLKKYTEGTFAEPEQAS